jgi:hypothetical protein
VCGLGCHLGLDEFTLYADRYLETGHARAKVVVTV